MANNKQGNRPNVPSLRFPGFTDEWQKRVLRELVSRVTRKNRGNKSELPLTISAQYGLVDQITFFNKKVASQDMSNYYLLKKGEFAYNKSYSGDYPWGAVKRLDRYDEGALSSLYICFAPTDLIDSDFLVQYFESPKWYRGVSEIAGEGARNHGLLNIAIDDYFNTQHFVPREKDEQEKIAQFLSLIDERIATQRKIIEGLETLIRGIRKRVFNSIRSQFGLNSSFGEWLTYEQPSKYLVESTEYSEDNTLIPVLTANKAFILGYTDEDFGIYSKGPCIILDDFTLDCKLVVFPFKIKSSAIKILTAKNDILLSYMFEYFKYLELETTEHQRHYISQIEPMPISVPDENTIEKVVQIFSCLNTKHTSMQHYLSLLEKQRQFLLSKLFI